ATRGDFALAMAASCGFTRRGCYYQGPNDLWNLLKTGTAISHLPNCVNDGNVLVAGEIDHRKSGGEFVLALGFGSSPPDAIRNAAESSKEDFGDLAARYLNDWRTYRRHCIDLAGISTNDVFETSVAVLKTHVSKSPNGGVVASLGVP